MADTLQFQCRDRGKITERLQNPRTCPACGEPVMRPVEVSEPGDDTNTVETENFDVESAVADLENMKDAPSDESKNQPADTESAGETHQQSHEASSDATGSKSLLSRIRSLF